MTPDDGGVSAAEIVVSALTGQQCTLVRDSLGDQLVVGFGPVTRADWPLRQTMHASWLLYTSFGSWVVTDGVGDVASDAAPLDDKALQRVRAVLFHQHVRSAAVDPDAGDLAVHFDNGAALLVRPHPDMAVDEDAWTLKAPNGLSVEAWTDRLTVVRHDGGGTLPDGTTAAAAHRVIRDVATVLGLTLFEPLPDRDAGFDAVLVARDGTMIVLQLAPAGTPPAQAIRAVTVRTGELTPTSVDIAVTPLSVDAMASEVRRVLSAA